MTRALIVGAGIAGTACAIALRKAGIDVDLCDAQDPQGIGAFLTLAVNGVDALQAIDVPAENIGFATPRMEVRLSDGRPLIEFGTGRRAGDLCARTVRRSDLYATLRNEAVHRGARLESGLRLRSARRRSDGQVEAEFADGSRRLADVLVGADGIHSTLRQLLDARAPRARYVGLLNIGGFARGVDVQGPAGTMELNFGRRSFFGSVKAPEGDVWWFANPWLPREPERDELRSRPAGWWRDHLLQLFERDRFPARALIEATPQLTPVWPTYDFPRVPLWQRDGMVIIGDAAHAAAPSSGQGASMAIEDGVTLALCLRNARGVDAALGDYERRRRARTERVVQLGRRNGTGKTPGPLGRVLRDAMLRLVFARGSDAFQRSQEWLSEHHMGW
jgi:2-polyprenyl-6-methoxyphenol hydroxylase-like FAD-dependent oxidoreductase